MRAAEQDRPDVQEARVQWQEIAPSWDPRHLVFLDETGLNTKMARLYGRAPRSARCQSSVPHGHWSTSTFIAALRHDGLTAPWLLDGPMDRAAFTTYIEDCLGPTLSPGDIVIADNLSSHKGPAITAAIECRGAKLVFLPPVQSRSQSDRIGLLQTQSLSARHCRPHFRRSSCSSGGRARHLPTSTLRQFL